MSAVRRLPPEVDEDELLAGNLAYRQQLREQYEQDSLDTRRAIFAYAVFGLVIVAAFITVGVILSPGFTGF